MVGTFHTKEFKDEAMMIWNLNFDLPKKKRLTQLDCAAHISQKLKKYVSPASIREWKNNYYYEDAKKGVERGSYKTKSKQKIEYDELVEFCDQLLIDENKLREENLRLIKRVNELEGPSKKN